MKRPCLLFAGCVIAFGSFVQPLRAADAPVTDQPAVTTASPNAAVIYWQAFAAMPCAQ